MRREDFLSASVQTRILEKSLLNKEQLHSLAEADSLDEMYRILSETSYQQDVANISDRNNYEEILEVNTNRLYKELYEVSPDPRIVDIMALRYVFHNLKVLAKEILQNEDFSNILVPIGELPVEKLRLAEKAGGLNSVEDYGPMLEQILSEFGEHKDPGQIDLAVDRLYAIELSKLAEEIDNTMISDYVRDSIDLYNIITLFRMKSSDKTAEEYRQTALTGGYLHIPQLVARYFDPIDTIAQGLLGQEIGGAIAEGLARYENDKRLSSFEQAMEDHFMKKVHENILVSVGPEVLISYIIAKETEIKNLRILFVAKTNDMSADFARERLRLTYV